MDILLVKQGVMKNIIEIIGLERIFYMDIASIYHKQQEYFLDLAADAFDFVV